MPIIDGLESTRMIRALLSQVETGDVKLKEGVDLETVVNTPIVALTANDSAEDRKVCFEAGMSEFLCKPPSMKDLLKLINKVLN